jgi:hypothetical protein
LKKLMHFLSHRLPLITKSVKEEVLGVFVSTGCSVMQSDSCCFCHLENFDVTTFFWRKCIHYSNSPTRTASDYR